MAKLVIGNNKTTGVPAVYRELNKNKFGITIDNLIGNVDANGVLGAPATLGSITLTGVRVVPTRTFDVMFWGAVFQPNSTFSAPDLMEVQGDTGDLAERGAFTDAFHGTTNLTTISMPNLTTIGEFGLDSACKYSDVSAFNFASLQSVSSYGLYSTFESSKVVNASFPSLKTVYSRGCQGIFYGDTVLESASFPELEEVGNYGFYNAFTGCSALSSLTFSKLKTIGNYGFSAAFRGGTSSLQTLSFPALETVGAYVFGNSNSSLAFTATSGITEIHFPAAIQSDIEALYGYANKFGAPNATIYFDL